MRQWYVAYMQNKHLSAVAEAFLGHMIENQHQRVAG